MPKKAVAADPKSRGKNHANQLIVIGYRITDNGVKVSFFLPPGNDDDSFADFNLDFSSDDLPPPGKNAKGEPYYKYTQLVAAFLRLMQKRLYKPDVA